MIDLDVGASPAGRDQRWPEDLASFDPARDLEEGPCPACGGSGSEEDEDGKRWCCSRCDGDGTTEELR